MTDEDITANEDFDTGLRLGIASALGQTGFNSQFDDNPRRNLYENFGWPKDDLDGWNEENWLAMYLRNGYAQVVNDKLAEVCWRDDPELTDTPESEDTSEFEAAIERLDKNLNLWSYLHRADKVAGIGQHGLLLIGTSDIPSAENPEQQWEESAFDQNFTAGLDDVDSFKPVLETQIDDIQWGGPEDGDRWGKPVRYTIDFSDDIDDETEDDQGYRDVHWSRVIDIPAQVPLDDETLSRPRAEPVLNNLLDIEKTLGATAEAAFMSANSDIHLNADPTQVDMSQGADEVRDELMRYFEGQPFLRTQGMDVEQLGGEVQDPSGIIENNLDVIASTKGIPKSTLRGNQSGEVSGSEKDERDLFGTAEERRTQYVTPYLVRETIDRLDEMGVIPQPEGGMYEISWPDLKQLSELDRSKIQTNRAQVIRQAGAVTNLGEDYLRDGTIPEEEEMEPMPPETEEMQAQFDAQFGLVDNLDGIDLTPPDAAQNHAQDVLDWRDDKDKDVSGMKDTGWSRAEQLASGEELSPSDIQEINAWFARHGPEEYKLNQEDMDPWKDNGRVAIKGWGGPTMRDWVGPKRRRLAEMGELEPVGNANRYSEGDTVSTPQGIGVVVDTISEDQPEADIEASPDSPTYAVLVEDARVGVDFYKASDIKQTDGLEVDVDNPESDLSEEIISNSDGWLDRLKMVMRGNQDGRFDWPDSWEQSDTPARLIAMKAWAAMGADVSGCIREMRGNVTRPGAFCADFADRLYGTDFWRGDSWAPGD